MVRRLSLKEKKDAIEDVTRLVRGDGIGSLAQGILEFVLLECEQFTVRKFREGREFVFGKAVDFEENLPAAQGGDILAFNLHMDLSRW